MKLSSSLSAAAAGALSLPSSLLSSLCWTGKTTKG